MSQREEPTLADFVRTARAFTLNALEEDTVKLRPPKPRIRAPITPTAQTIYRALVFHFENAETGECFPSLRTIANRSGSSTASVTRLLPELRRCEYLHWRKGKRRLVMTRKGRRFVRGTNEYRLTCPKRHLANLRRALIRFGRGQQTRLLQIALNRFTPPTEEEKEATQIITALAKDLRPGSARTDHTASPTRDSDPPSQGPPASQGGVEIAGVQVDDPKLASVLQGLWTAMEKRERRDP